MKRWVALALVSFIPTLALGQSLAEVAKKEKERREKNKAKGVQSRTVDESNLERRQPAAPRPSAPDTETVSKSQDPKAAIDNLLVGKSAAPPTPRTTPKPAPTPRLTPIKPAPPFSLEDRQGRSVSLNDFRGRPVLIDFWATWCAPCRSTMPEVQRLHQKYRSRGLQVVGINIEGKTEGVLNFLDESGYNFTVLFDSGNWKSGVAQKYQVSSIPRSFLIDKNGSIVYSGHPDRLSESLIEAALQ